MDTGRSQIRWACVAMWVVFFAMMGMWAAKAHADQAPPPPPFYILYDVNRDGVVDTKDIAKFAEYWKAYHSSGAYNAVADFNGDERIDYFDAMKLIGAVLQAQGSSQARVGPSQGQRAVKDRLQRQVLYLALLVKAMGANGNGAGGRAAGQRR